MTTFQLVSLGLFLAALAVTKRQELLKLVTTLTSNVQPSRVPNSSPETSNRAKALVDDLVTIADLRDRLTAVGCLDGAEACTVLLRILVEYRPNKG